MQKPRIFQNRKKHWAVIFCSILAGTLYLTLCYFTLIDIDVKELPKIETGSEIEQDFEAFESIAQDHLQNEITAEKAKIRQFIKEYSCSRIENTDKKPIRNSKISELKEEVIEFVNQNIPEVVDSLDSLTSVQTLITSWNPLRAFLINSTVPIGTVFQQNILRSLLAIDSKQVNRSNRFLRLRLSLTFDSNHRLIEIQESGPESVRESTQESLPKFVLGSTKESIEESVSESTKSNQTHQECDKDFARVRTEFQDDLDSLFESDSVGIVGIHCDQSHTVCLDFDDVGFLLDSLFQVKEYSGFKNILFPRFEDDSLDKTFEETMIALAKRVKTKQFPGFIYKTETIHALLKMLRKPEVGLISLIPKHFRLIPEFSPGISHYQVDRKCPYEEISTEFNVSFRKAYIRFEDSDTGNGNILTFTLGFGSNRILLPVYSESNKHLKTYSIDVVREDRQTGNGKAILQSCDFYQDCAMPVLSDRKCGIQNATEYSCEEHGVGGRWRIPCESCIPEVNCDWRFAQWLPARCEKQKQETTSGYCLSNWKLIFVGDSTNRGIFHRTVEVLNGTLTDGAKTHDATQLEIARGIHAEFHYYPKFWIDLADRPTFEQVIENLRIRNRSEQIALIVGGAQWLDVRHVYFLQSYKERFGLKNLHIVIKGLGSGFHQPVSGIHHHLNITTLTEMTKHNENILQAAFRRGISVLDTWAPTVSRFRDFYPGKCSCHFHQLIKTTSGSFHVAGDINDLAVSSLFTQLCDNSTIP